MSAKAGRSDEQVEDGGYGSGGRQPSVPDSRLLNRVSWASDAA